MGNVSPQSSQNWTAIGNKFATASRSALTKLFKLGTLNLLAPGCVLSRNRELPTQAPTSWRQRTGFHTQHCSWEGGPARKAALKAGGGNRLIVIVAICGRKALVSGSGLQLGGRPVHGPTSNTATTVARVP
ncbi:hypothetical protein GGTG_08519 [Gaeumannomyces tritici R3-111a-1]|uniref:Uncharacterized protein n=1 Tax=Gaeumannomyces tritici (strain R3-111a-1) TaxID=644352 RepID=J3P4T4_GAET3|nr:hypothetical protein GGTG_08519 [Gaeumannomyces tritici R3-111a-1]EJT74681.1 hypothetical protein GGTG_08519 [Gaeumannomyces tritici R3-111a-1]